MKEQIKKYLPYGVVVVILIVIGIFTQHSVTMTEKEREMYKHEYSLLLVEKMELQNKLRESTKAVDIEEVKNVDGSTKRTVKIREATKESESKVTKENTTKEDKTTLALKEKDKKTVKKGSGVFIGVGPMYVPGQTKQDYSVIITAPILGAWGIGGFLGTNGIFGVGIGKEF